MLPSWKTSKWKMIETYLLFGGVFASQVALYLKVRGVSGRIDTLIESQTPAAQSDDIIESSARPARNRVVRLKMVDFQ